MLVSYLVSIAIVSILFFKGEDKVSGNIWFELYIPRINLRKFVYTMDSDLNDVDYNVEILNSSDTEKNLFFLASHSGGGPASYFDNLVYLEEGDIIWLSGNSGKYAFVVKEKNYIQKTGYFNMDTVNDENVLYLITCSLRYVDRQLVVESRLIYKC